MRLLRHIIDALDLSVYSYVKPGAIHRFSLQDDDLHRYVRVLTSSIHSYLSAAELGELVARGSLSFPSLDIGRLITQSISSSLRWLDRIYTVELHLTLLPSVTAISYAFAVDKAAPLSTFRKAILNILSSSSVKDSLEVYNIIKDLPVLTPVISELGITEGYLRVNSMNLYNLYITLGRRLLPIDVLVNKLDIIIGMSNKFLKTYYETLDYNIASVAAYIDGLEKVFDTRIKVDLAKGRTAINELLKIDKDLKSKGKDFNEMIPLLNISILLSLCILESN